MRKIIWFYNMSEITTLELSGLEFAAGHFTILTPTVRERLHGHNFSIVAKIKADSIPNLGMAFDYRLYKKILSRLCQKLDGYFLLPTASPYLTVEEKGEYYYAYFNEDKIPFLKKDVLLLPLKNINVEELAKWFIKQLTADKEAIEKYRILDIHLQVFSAPGQGASACWKTTNNLDIQVN
jgi:6-pyruvoyltetrahydropterin/6-carboxytetrahydropterin synthase